MLLFLFIKIFFLDFYLLGLYIIINLIFSPLVIHLCNKSSKSYLIYLRVSHHFHVLYHILLFSVMMYFNFFFFFWFHFSLTVQCVILVNFKNESHFELKFSVRIVIFDINPFFKIVVFTENNHQCVTNIHSLPEIQIELVFVLYMAILTSSELSLKVSKFDSSKIFKLSLLHVLKMLTFYGSSIK